MMQTNENSIIDKLFICLPRDCYIIIILLFKYYKVDSSNVIATVNTN